MQRPANQSFEDYRAYRADLNATIKRYSLGQLVWTGGTYRTPPDIRMRALPFAVYCALHGPK